MGTIYDPLSQNDLSASNVGDAGVFTQNVGQAPIFPQQMGAYQVGTNPAIEGARQALQANSLAHQANQTGSQVAMLQQSAAASQLANQLSAAKIQQGMQQNAQDQYWHNQITPGLNQQYSNDTQRINASTAATNQFALQNLQSNSRIADLQSQSAILPLQGQIQQAQFQGRGNQLNNQYANLTNNLQNYQAYNPDFRSMQPLDNTADPSELAKVQFSRASNLGSILQVTGLDQVLKNGQPLKPEDVLTNANFLALRQQDPQTANNLSISLFGMPADGMIARLQQQHQAAETANTSAANKMIADGTVRRGADGFLQRNIAAVGLPAQWKDVGTDDFPIEQASVIESGIEHGGTGLPLSKDPAAQVTMAIMQRSPGTPKAQAQSLAKQLIANKLHANTAAALSQPSDGLRPLTDVQQQMVQQNPPANNQSVNFPVGDPAFIPQRYY